MGSSAQAEFQGRLCPSRSQSEFCQGRDALGNLSGIVNFRQALMPGLAISDSTSMGVGEDVLDLRAGGWQDPFRCTHVDEVGGMLLMGMPARARRPSEPVENFTEAGFARSILSQTCSKSRLIFTWIDSFDDSVSLGTNYYRNRQFIMPPEIAETTFQR